MNSRVTVRQRAAIIVLALLEVVLLVVVAVRVKSNSREIEVPGVVVDFLDEYLSPEWTPDDDRSVVLSGKFLELEGVSAEKMWDTHLVTQVLTVFHTLEDNNNPPVGYSLRVVSDSFIIIDLLDSDGNTLPPPIGFWFTVVDVNGVQMIDDWYLCRLLPFSKYDEETTEGWYELYG